MSLRCTQLCPQPLRTAALHYPSLRLSISLFSTSHSPGTGEGQRPPPRAAPRSRPRLTVTESRSPALPSPSTSLAPPTSSTSPRSSSPPPRVRPSPLRSAPRAPGSNPATVPVHRRQQAGWVQWLAQRLGYDELRPVLALYASASTRAAAASLTSPGSLQVAASTDGHCALLTLHMWALHCRVRELMFQARALGDADAAGQWKQMVHILFELYWQEMDSLVRDARKGEEGAAPRVFTVREYTQLAYGAMVSYDRAWQKLRKTGEKGDLLGALWRNVHAGRAEMSEAHLHRLLLYTEQLRQRSNRWTEAELLDGTVDWGPLPAEDGGGEDEGGLVRMLRYTPEVHDGTSRVREGESMGVPVRWRSLWGRGNDEMVDLAEDVPQQQRCSTQPSLPDSEQQQPGPQLTPIDSKVDKG